MKKHFTVALWLMFCTFASFSQTVVDIIVNSPDHNTLEAAVIAAELADDLSGAGPFTVFAPTDAAFAALPAGTVEALLQDPTGDLAQILLYHVVSGQALSTDLADGDLIVTLQGGSVSVTINADGVFINGAQVTVADLLADNGVVHVIDAVLLPVTTEPCIDFAGGPYTDFNGVFGGAPVPNAQGECPINQITTFEAWASEAYTVNGFVAGTEYNFSICEGPNAGSWEPELAILDINGNLIASAVDCQITWTAPADGTYLIVINEVGACGTSTNIQTDNGYPTLTCTGTVASTVVDIIVNSPDHNTLEAAVIAAELADDLSGAGPFTVFAPTDAAFAALPAGTVEALLQDPTGDLAQILLYHVVSGEALSTDLNDGDRIVTLEGRKVRVTINADGVFINDAQVTVADVLAGNGVVHVIDAVLLPPPATVVDIIVNSPDHNTLEAAVIAAELADDLSGAGPFTVFAPTDAAFAALPAGTVEALLQDPTGDLAQILLYHVVGGEALSTDLNDGDRIVTLEGRKVRVTINADGVFINDAQVVVADIFADNGVVHVIDAVLLPPPATVVDIIVNSPDHNTLEAAVIAAELADDLSGEGPFTVFAPTDAAFAALPAGTVEALLQDPTGELAQILLYHVVGGEALSTDLNDGDLIATLQGGSVRVTINADGVFINNAQVVVADIFADNGVVHVIDAVLLPPSTTVVDIIVDSPDHNTLEAAVIAAELADDLSGAGPFTVFAPTDAAFAALPAGTVEALLQDPTGELAQILLYHVVGGQALSTDLNDGDRIVTLEGRKVRVTINADGVFINNAQVTVADLIADNGVVHVIDAVLLPPPATVVDIIVNSPDHNTLEAAVIAAELADDLSGEGPFTVFAPTDAAFAALPAGTVEALLQDPTGTLATILLYHVAAGEVLAGDLSNGQSVPTLQGESATISITGDGAFIDNAQIIVTDLFADNGVVHVINAVILPRAVSTAEPSYAADIKILSNPVRGNLVVELPTQLAGQANFTLFSTTGQPVLQAPSQGFTQRMDVSTLAAGVYVLKIEGNDATIFRKVVVVQ